MDVLNDIYVAITAEGFTNKTLQMIDNYTNDIRYGRKDFNGFTLPEHAGLCKGGSPLIGAAIVVSYARRSLTTGCNVESSQGGSPANVFVDVVTGKPICIDCIVKFVNPTTNNYMSEARRDIKANCFTKISLLDVEQTPLQDKPSKRF